jgi:pimeloyl-ACP methyl ester carboxylesterase
VLGYGERGAVSLVAAGREDRIGAVGLLAVPGTTGMDATLEQQRLMLQRMGASPADEQARIALQQQILDAVVSGRGWDKIPLAVRRQADTPWFKSWLQFDPAAAIKRLDQPILIVHGGLDTEVPASHADALEAFSSGRKRPASHTRKVVVPGVNHLFVPATTGGVDEYPVLPNLVMADEVAAVIVQWLATALPPR